jgi:tetratricopeptide (TPR) repeat protein
MSVQHLIREGKLLYQGGKIPDAIAKWQQALLREPTNSEAQELIRSATGLQATVPGERTQTLRVFTEGLQDAETSRRLADEKLKQGMVLLKQNRTAEAVQALEAANRLDPGREEIQRVLARVKEQYLLEEKVEEIYRAGLANLEAGEYTEAVTKFLRVLAADDRHTRAKASLEKAKAALASSGPTPGGGGTSGLLGAKERAKELFREGVEAYKRDDLGEAIRLWQEVIRLDPAHPRAAKYREKALDVFAQRGGATSASAAASMDLPGPTAAGLIPQEMDTKSGNERKASSEPEEPPLDDAIVWEATHESASAITGRGGHSDAFEIAIPTTPASRQPTETGPDRGSAESFDPFASAALSQSSNPFLINDTDLEVTTESRDTRSSSGLGSTASNAGLATSGAGAGSFDPFGSFGAPPPGPPPGVDPFEVRSAASASSDPFRVPERQSATHASAFDPFAVPQAGSDAVGAEPFDPFSEVVAQSAAAARPSESFASSSASADPFGDVSFQLKKHELERSVSQISSDASALMPSATPEISLVAADFLGEVKASSAHSTAPPPKWIGGDELSPPTEPAGHVVEAPTKIEQSPEELLEEGRRSMADERYEEAINTFKKVLERSTQSADAKVLLDRAMQCLGARDQLAHALEQAEQASAAGDWESAARHAAKMLQMNPYLRRAQQIATQAHSLAPIRAGGQADPARAAVSGAPVINPFTARKSVNPLAPQVTKPARPRRWPVAFVALFLLGTGGFFMAQKWQETVEDRAKAERAFDLRRRQQQEAQELADRAQEAAKSGNLVQARDLLTKAATLDPQHKEIKSRLQKVQGSLDQQTQPFLDRAQQFLERSQYDKAITEAQNALQVDPANSRASSVRTTATRYRDTQGSSEEKIFRISNFQKYIERGDEAFEKKRYDEARDYFEVALELSPNNDVAGSRLGKVSGKLMELRTIRSREGALVDEALKLLEQRKFRAALDKINSVLEAVPDSVKAKSALERIQTALDRQKNLDLYKKMALQYYQVGKDAQALEYFKKWYELEPDNREAKFYIEQLKQAGN